MTTQTLARRSTIDIIATHTEDGETLELLKLTPKNPRGNVFYATRRGTEILDLGVPVLAEWQRRGWIDASA